MPQNICDNPRFSSRTESKIVANFARFVIKKRYFGWSPGIFERSHKVFTNKNVIQSLLVIGLKVWETSILDFL